MTTPLNSERGDYPSASEFPRIFSCPGSLSLTRTLRKATKRTETSSSDADEGEFMHEVTMGRLPRKGLSDEQEGAVDTAHYYREVAREEAGMGEDATLKMEERLWVKDPFGQLLYSGRFDELHSTAGAALILDYKFGRNEVTPAQANTQLMAYAVAVWQTYGFETIYAAIIQPRVRQEDRYSMTRWTAKLLPQGYQRFLNQQFELCKDPDAPRIPSVDACRYCPAFHFCPEARAFFTSIPKPQTKA